MVGGRFIMLQYYINNSWRAVTAGYMGGKHNILNFNLPIQYYCLRVRNTTLIIPWQNNNI